MVRTLGLGIMLGMLFTLSACASTGPGATPTPKVGAGPAAGDSKPQDLSSKTATVSGAYPTLTLIGQASVKIKTKEGVVIYIDPYYKGDYSEKADIILVSHEHSDHNKIDLVTQNKDCVVLRVKNTINPADNSYNTFEYYGVKIEPVPASNKNHPLSSTNGFVLTFDGVTIYHASDTSKLSQMAALKTKNIDYAFFPIDGNYNMGPAEAMECAEMVGAKHNTPFHVNTADVAAFAPKNLLSVKYGETIDLIAR